MPSWKWSLWMVFLVLWTWALISPVPEPEQMPLGDLIRERRYLIAKSLHMGVYAAWTLASGFLPMPARGRFLLAAGLMGHGTLTEFLQFQFSEWSHRDGNLRDVGFDNLGVLLGLLIGWKAWTREDS